MRSIPSLFCLAVWWIAGYPTLVAAPKASLTTAEIDQSVAQLAKITGLPPLRKVQADTITRSGVRKFLEEKIKEEVDPKDIRLEELCLKRFGLLPRDFDLKAATVDLITEQAAAFYDFRTKKLYMLEGDEPQVPGAPEGFGKSAERMIVVHELAHALADQRFDLGKYIKKSRNDDSSTARMAVMEGQATWLMMEAMAQSAGRSMRDNSAMVDLMGASASGSMASQYPVLAGAPLYLRASLIFPYNQGLKFQHAVVQKLGTAAFTEVFKQPPVSTQQILHPDQYFAKLQPIRVQLPNLPSGWHMSVESTVGEFDHQVLLEQYLSRKEAEGIAPHWRGATVGVAERKKDGVALLYASEWDSPEWAKKMFDAYRVVLKKKWKTMDVTAETENSFSGNGDDGPFRVSLAGNQVISIEGLATDRGAVK